MMRSPSRSDTDCAGHTERQRGERNGEGRIQLSSYHGSRRTVETPHRVEEKRSGDRLRAGGANLKEHGRQLSDHLPGHGERLRRLHLCRQQWTRLR